MKEKDIDTSVQIQDLLKKINMKISHVMIKEFGDKELTMHQLYILKEIFKNPNINLTSLGNHLNLSKSSICLTINKLVEEGYVIRKEDAEDRRNKYLVLSEEGKRIMHEAKDRSRQIFSSLLSDLTQEELVEVKNNLGKLDISIEKNMNQF